MAPARDSSTLTNPAPGPRALRARIPPQNGSPRVVTPANNHQLATCDSEVDFIAQLNDLAKQMQLPPPTYKTDRLYSQKYPGKPLPPRATEKFVSRVFFADAKAGGNFSITTFPDDFPTTEQAMRAAAKKAYQQLKSRETAEKAKRAPCGQSLVTKRIVQIVAKELAGFHSDAIEGEYKKLFSESLPTNWIDLARENEILAVETFPAFNKTTTTIRLKRQPPTCDASSVTLTEHPAPYPTHAKHPLKSQVGCGDASHLMKQVSNITLNPSYDASATTPSCLFSPKVSLEQQQTQNTSVPKEIKTPGPTNSTSNGNSVILPTCANPAGTSTAQQAKNSFNSKYSNSISNEGAKRVSQDSQPRSNSLLVLANEPVKHDVIITGAEIPHPARPVASLDFDVIVTHVKSPSSFWVQRFNSTHSEFNRLLKDMKQFYDSEDESIELNPHLLKAGSYFAAKFYDLWYRVVTLSVKNESPDPLDTDQVIVTAFFVDTGLTFTMHYKCLQPLYSMFRELPRQAYHLCLSSVQPANSNDGTGSGTWSEEAIKHFRELTYKKPFVSRIESIQSDSCNDCIIFLKSMVDTSTSEDILIEEKLVESGHAIPKNI